MWYVTFVLWLLGLHNHVLYEKFIATCNAHLGFLYTTSIKLGSQQKFTKISHHHLICLQPHTWAIKKKKIQIVVGSCEVIDELGVVVKLL